MSQTLSYNGGTSVEPQEFPIGILGTGSSRYDGFFSKEGSGVLPIADIAQTIGVQGLKLKTPVTTQLMYDQAALDAIKNDTTGNLLGSTSPKKMLPLTKFQTIAGVGAEALSSMGNILSTAKTSSYYDNITAWKSQGKYWFDPSANLKPDIESYMALMPEAKDSISGAGTAMKIAGAAGSGAAAGAVLGAPGAIVGGGVGALVGTVESIFGWHSAKDANVEAKKQALAQYERALKEWTINKNNRIAAMHASQAAASQAAAESKAVTAKANVAEAKATRRTATAARRARLATAINNATNARASRLQISNARWA